MLENSTIGCFSKIPFSYNTYPKIRMVNFFTDHFLTIFQSSLEPRIRIILTNTLFWFRRTLIKHREIISRKMRYSNFRICFIRKWYLWKRPNRWVFEHFAQHYYKKMLKVFVYFFRRQKNIIYNRISETRKTRTRYVFFIRQK